ncbi:IS66 family insertion sequence element accessory protein TnpB, partial [Escherichia coli]
MAATGSFCSSGVTDMRKSFNGLGEQVQHVLNDNPFSGHLFIFRG